MSSSEQALADGIGRIAIEAGAAIMQIYASDFAVEVKADSSPVTEADQRAEAGILAGRKARLFLPVAAQVDEWPLKV